MNKVASFTVNNRRALIFIFLFLWATGFYLVNKIPQGVFPDATFPRIAVMVDYGLTPIKEMEMEVAKPIEEAVMMVEGVQCVRSSISRGSAEINIDFQWNADMFQAYQLVQAQVSGIQSELPAGVTLEVRRFTTSTYPVAGYSLYSDKEDLLQLRDIAVYTLRPQLASIPGVYNVEVMGGKEREFRVELDPDKLAAYQMNYNEIARAIQENNSLNYVGRLEEFNKLYLNIADNRYQKMSEIENTIIRNQGETPIRLKDVAKVVSSVKETFIACESNQHPAVLITIIKQPGTNAVSIMKAVDEKLAELRPVLPEDVNMSKWYDMTRFIRSSVNNVRDSILIGAFLTMLILLIFLRRLRITLVTVIIIPVAVMISFIFIKLTGMNLSVMSLGGLAAAIGILVDNAIVVVENIERHLEMGKTRKQAVMEATGEIITPLLSATLTTLVVLVPLVFLTGVPGIFFKALALTLTLAILASMLLAVFLTPAVAVTFISTKKRKPGKMMARIVNAHQKTLKFGLKKPVTAYVLIVVTVAASIYLFKRIPSGFLPLWDEGTIVLDYLAPPGSSVDGTRTMLKTITDYLPSIPEVEDYSLRTGRSLAHPRTHANDGDFVINLKQDRNRSAFEIMDELRNLIEQKEPNLSPEIFQVLPDRLNDLSGEIAPVVVKVYGKNLETIQQVAAGIADSLENIDGVVDIYPGFEAGEPELTIHIKPEVVTRFGLTPQSVNDAIYMALWGTETTRIMEGIKLIPVRMRYPYKYASHFEQIETLPLFFPEIKRTVALNEIADVKKVPGKTDIEHENLSQVVNIEAQISGRDLGSTAADIQQLLHDQHLPPGVTVQLSGQYESQQRAFSELLLILLLAALIIFIILLFEFKTFRTALAILIGTALSVSGVFLFLWLTDTTLDISAFMGMIMIIGVVVNNGILLIDYTEKYLKENPIIPEALLMASRVRLRPILMTTLSSIFGFIPLAFAIGEGAEMLKPLAISMIGGMSLSMIFSLFVIPVLYQSFNGKKVNVQISSNASEMV
ncbi:efflux RND transporter permease subunit [Draconibacterium orientale]|uniref:efflux RND transporter permease subunit n=1 Tax=Draconibacterium orientale TaxID=1168034 RepID=UPI002A0A6CED|nr:efflux RND transporter permease subunit [Draconibacterium orientale]